MLGTVKYEIKELYRDSTVYGFWKDDKEISVPVREIKKDEADKFIALLISIGAKYYETSKAHFYEVTSDARHMSQYIFYK